MGTGTGRDQAPDHVPQSLMLTYPHSCTIQRYLEIEDPYGNVTRAPDPIVVGRRLPCRLKVDQEKIQDAITGQLSIVTAFRLFVPIGQDIAEGDRVSELIEGDGSTLEAGDHEVNSVIAHSGALARHKTAVIEKVA